MNLTSLKVSSYFDQGADVGIIGRGETIELCFCDAARVMFNIVMDVNQVHLIKILSFTFEEKETEVALVKWLNLLIAKSKEHHLWLGDFRLVRKNTIWHAVVSGAADIDTVHSNKALISAKSEKSSVQKIDHLWEARCVIEV